jgi:hypothetical protein
VWGARVDDEDRGGTEGRRSLGRLGDVDEIDAAAGAADGEASIVTENQRLERMLVTGDHCEPRARCRLENDDGPRDQTDRDQSAIDALGDKQASGRSRRNGTGAPQYGWNAAFETRAKIGGQIRRRLIAPLAVRRHRRFGNAFNRASKLGVERAESNDVRVKNPLCGFEEQQPGTSNGGRPAINR